MRDVEIVRPELYATDTAVRVKAIAELQQLATSSVEFEEKQAARAVRALSDIILENDVSPRSTPEVITAVIEGLSEILCCVKAVPVVRRLALAELDAAQCSDSQIIAWAAARGLYKFVLAEPEEGRVCAVNPGSIFRREVLLEAQQPPHANQSKVVSLVAKAIGS